MAKVSAPLLGFGAAGQIGNTQVYSKWKGIPYARRYVIPANPKSTEQTKTRNVFSYLNGLYKFFGSNAQAPWEAFVKGKPLTARNAIQKANVSNMRGEVNNDLFVGSPGANGGIVADGIALADGGTHHITVTMGVPDVPDGWTITDSIAVALPAGNPQTITDFTTYEAASGDAGGVVSILAVAGDYVVSGWFKMTKPDGSIAYGPSLTDTVTIA